MYVPLHNIYTCVCTMLEVVITHSIPGSGNDGRTAESGGGEEEEEEVDFGYWEKAELPPEPPSDSDPTATTAAAALPAAPLPPHEESEKSVPSPVPQLKEMDLSLL